MYAALVTSKHFLKSKMKLEKVLGNAVTNGLSLKYIYVHIQYKKSFELISELQTTFHKRYSLQITMNFNCQQFF